ncbi:MAG: TerB family tellurite resistance protein [Alphaproteobacteria bacterium]|nr:TerB family tellurite resistance protein [Alphaproteobacteria bacterium]
MQAQVSESRYYMWRAIFAAMHADHKVTDEERAFAGNYLSNVPFSEEQKTVLRNDLDTPKDIAEMFEKITDPADRGEFFEFTRNLLWADGDYARAEEQMFEHMMKSWMLRLNPEKLRAEVKKAFDLSRLKREAEDEQFRQEAEAVLSPMAMLKSMIGR